MDIYSEISRDHRELLRLVRHILQVNRGDVTARRRELLAQLTFRFEAHAVAKRDVFYPILAALPSSENEVEEALRTHDEVLWGLRDLQGFDPRHQAWMARFKPLAERISQTFDHEEKVLFKALQESVDAHQAMHIGRLVREIEEQRPQ